MTASIASEPIDWVCSVNEYLETGNVKPLIIGLIPFIPNIAKAKGVWLSLKKAADLDANDILKFHKHSGIGAGARSGMHGVPYNKAATDLEQLAKEPGLLPEYRNELLKKAEEFRQKAHEINHLMR